MSPDVAAPDPGHEARALDAIKRAYREIPFYSKHARPALEGATSLAEALRELPLFQKRDIRATLPRQWVPTTRDVKGDLGSGALELLETAGTTGDRARVLLERGWWAEQRLRAMRTHAGVAAALDGEGYREAVLATPASGMRTCNVGDLPYEARVVDGQLLLNMRPDPTFWTPEEMVRMLDELERHATVGLESNPTYLAILARHARSLGRSLAVTGFVQLTYGLTSEASLRAIREVTAAPMHQLYAAREVGTMFVEGAEGRLHHAPVTTHVELLPARVETPGATNVALVVATTLDRASMPLVRYVVGDLVQVDPDGPHAFTTVAPLRSVEGRIEDALVRPDGAIVTAGAIDRALAPIGELRSYQVNQRTPERVEIDVVGGGEALVTDVLARLAPLVRGLEATARTTTAVPAEPSGRFRTVRRHFTLDLAQAFEGT